MTDRFLHYHVSVSLRRMGYLFWYGSLTFMFVGVAVLGHFAIAQEPPNTVISISDLAPLIEDVLIAEGASPGIIVSFNNPDLKFVTQTAISEANIVHRAWSAQSGRFVLRLATGEQNITIAGTARVPLTIPVLLRSLDRGDLISNADIEWLDDYNGPVRGVALTTNELLGNVARRPLTKGEPIRQSDVEKPILIKRGSLVTMDYESGSLRLRHQGEAQANGSFGDVIAVRNISSDRLLKAMVSGPGRVRIITSNNSNTVGQ